MLDEIKTSAMRIFKQDIKHYSTKSISGKYNTRIFEFVKGFTQNFNSKTTNSAESLTIREIELHQAMDKNEVLWLLDTQNIRVKAENRKLQVHGDSGIGYSQEARHTFSHKGETRSRDKIGGSRMARGEERELNGIRIKNRASSRTPAGEKQDANKSAEKKKKLKKALAQEERRNKRRASEEQLTNILNLQDNQLMIKNKTDNKVLL
jgi:hypothetical protein